MENVGFVKIITKWLWENKSQNNYFYKQPNFLLLVEQVLKHCLSPHPPTPGTVENSQNLFFPHACFICCFVNFILGPMLFPSRILYFSFTTDKPLLSPKVNCMYRDVTRQSFSHFARGLNNKKSMSILL